jgi:UDP-GlcNAc3NAcA epimerase
MSNLFFEELEIPKPDVHLGIGSGSHGLQTGRMLEAVERVLLEERPDFVVVYGDTNSTAAGALAAAKLNVPLAHVEAGLRSFNRAMPEEINRIVTDHCSDLLFAPTGAAVRNLRREGFGEDRISLVGDVMYDAALLFGPLSDRKSAIIESLQLEPRSYVLATIHRAENTNNPVRFRTLVEALSAVAEEIPVVLPLHPRTRTVLQESSDLAISPRVRLISPVGYLDMVRLEKGAAVIATDSGGIQKEAFFHSVPCVTLREETEWVELIDLGWNCLAPPREAHAVSQTILSACRTESPPRDPALEPFGNGRAAEAIRAALVTARERKLEGRA